MSDLSDLIPSLLEKTKQRKINWVEAGGNSYLARLGTANIELNRIGVPEILIRNEQATILERETYNTLSPPKDDMLQELYEVVARQVLKVDETMASLKSAIERL